jgi:autotransporter-associated beta strand protein
MSPPRHARLGYFAAAAALTWAVGSTAVLASTLDDIGVTQLRAQVPTLTGVGVVVAQPEATAVDPDPYFDHDNFEIDAAAAGVTVPITYVNSIGAEVLFDPAYTSSHATAVAALMAGVNGGVAPKLAEILNYNANEYLNYVVTDTTIPHNPQVINQSFTISPQGPFTADVLTQCWDTFVAAQGVIIVSGVGNGGDVQLPATAYNVIAVGAYGGASSVSQPGQLAKPDITAPAGVTSFSTPLVTGAAALLVQAATNLGDSNGVDPRVVKALLLNGAVKPGDWTHDSAVPLDRRYGAGVLNVFNSYNTLVAGEYIRTSSSTTGSVGGSHPPVNATTGLVGAVGWNLATRGSTGSGDGVDHYVIDLSQNPAGVPLILTATLTWQRDLDSALTTEIINTGGTVSAFTTAINTINNLDLYLYDANTQALVDQSVSSIDNVEHLYTLNLAPHKYDLQVLKNGGSVGSPNVYSSMETYGLAWNAASITTVKSVTNNVALTFSQTSSIAVAATILGPGALTQSGAGTTTLTGAANYSGQTVISAGQLTFGGGLSHSIAGVSGTGSLAVAAGTILTSDGVNMPTGSLTVGGTQAIRSSGTTGAYYNFATGQSSAALAGSSKLGKLIITGVLDITNNAFIVEALDAADKATMLAQVAGMLGTSITSSTAAANPSYALVEIDNASLVALNFGGLPVDTNSIILTQALKGDADLDGGVGPLDLGIWKANFGRQGKYSVTNGDFDHDGGAGPLDLAIWRSNFGNNLGMGAPSALPTDLTPTAGIEGGLSGGAAGGLVSAVPEASSLAVLALGALSLLWRRQDRRFA